MTRSRKLTSCLLSACLLLAASANHAVANEPGAQQLSAALETGQLAGYHDKLTAWLIAKTPAAGGVSEPAMEALLKDEAFAIALDQRQFIAKHGVAELEAFAKASAANRGLLNWLLGDTAKMDMYLEAVGPDTTSVEALDRLRQITEADPDAKAGVYLKLAMAIAIWPPNGKSYGSGLPIEWMSRYKHYKDAHVGKELFASFDTLSVWDMKHVVNSWASDRDLAWVRQMINTWRPDLRTDTKVVNIVSEVWRRNSPFPFSDGFVSVLAGGGKCGPRSWFGEMTCKAFGLPSMAMGQPGHSAVTYKSPDPTVEPQPGSSWKVCYGAGWHVTKRGYALLSEAAARDHAAVFSRVQHLTWLAATMTAKEQADAILAVAAKLDEATPKPGTGTNPAVGPNGEAIAFAVPNPTRPTPPLTNVPEPPIAVQPGVIHIEAETFTAMAEVRVLDCYTGGKQVNFQKNIQSSWVEYTVEAPAAGTYALTMCIAVANFEQVFEVSSGEAKLAKVDLPHTSGLWRTTDPVDVTLKQGRQTIRLSAPHQRGIAVRWLELKAK